MAERKPPTFLFTLAGICWQMFTMAVFVILVIVFAARVAWAKVELPRSLKVFSAGMAIVTVMIFIRCVYRTVELLGGWNGYIITHEVYFAFLEELPMILALVAFNVFHPGLCLPELALAENKASGVLNGKGLVSDVEMADAHASIFYFECRRVHPASNKSVLSS